MSNNEFLTTEEAARIEKLGNLIDALIAERDEFSTSPARLRAEPKEFKPAIETLLRLFYNEHVRLSKLNSKRGEERS